MYLNRVTLVGFLGQDARIAATQAGREVSRFSLATTRRYQQGSEWKEKTQWHDCVVYGKAAASAGKLSKGDHVLVEGELTYREYSRTVETEWGPVQVAWPVTEVIAESISRLDRTRRGGENEPEEAV
jgi:single-strand DNA-binding protein